MSFNCGNPGAMPILGCCPDVPVGIAIKTFAAFHSWFGMVRVHSLPEGSRDYCLRFLHGRQICRHYVRGRNTDTGVIEYQEFDSMQSDATMSRFGGNVTETRLELAEPRFRPCGLQWWEDLTDIHYELISSTPTGISWRWQTVMTLPGDPSGLPIAKGTFDVVYDDQYTYDNFRSDLVALYEVLPPFSAVAYLDQRFVVMRAAYVDGVPTPFSAVTGAIPSWPCLTSHPIVQAYGGIDRMLGGFAPAQGFQTGGPGALVRSAVRYDGAYCMLRTSSAQPNCRAFDSWIPDWFGGLPVDELVIPPFTRTCHDVNCEPLQSTGEFFLMPSFGGGVPGEEVLSILPQPHTAPASVTPCTSCNPAP